jgi:hypothetical protein
MAFGGTAPMLQRILALLCACFSAFALAGCANLTSIHRVDNLSSTAGGRLTFIDAKQRAILSTRVWDPATNRYVHRFCSEPPPDAFSAFSTSFTGDLAGTGLSGASPEVKARAALALSETAATIERTQTINLLRESLFRTSERYKGGAISNEEFIVQAARDQRAMVAVLAIEQLTGAVKAKSTVLSAGAAAATYTDPSALYDALKNAQEDETAAELDLTKAETTHKTIKLGDEGCEAIKAKKIPDAAADATEATKTETAKKQEELAGKKSECDAAAATVEVARTHVTNAKKRTATFTALAEKHVFGMSASAGTGADFDAGGGYTGPSQAIVEKVADAVKAIVKDTNSFNEVEMTCVVRLRNPQRKIAASLLEDELDRRCMTLIASQADALVAEADARKSAAVALANSLGSDSDALAIYLRGGPASISAKWDAALAYLASKATVAPDLLDQARRARSMEDIVLAFRTFNLDYRTTIVDAIRKQELK